MHSKHKGFEDSMKSDIEKTKKIILDIITSNDSIINKVARLNDLIGLFNPLEHSLELTLICDAALALSRKNNMNEMIAQLYFIKAKIEISKDPFLLHEIKNAKMAIGWQGFALQRERNQYLKMDQRLQQIWENTQRYLDTGFSYLNRKPLVGVVVYCYTIAGEIYGGFYLQKKLYEFGSGRPWRARIANYKIIRFLNIDDYLLINKKARLKIRLVQRDSLRFFSEAIKMCKSQNAYEPLARCYLSLALEHQSFSNPIRNRLALVRAELLINRFKLFGLKDRLNSLKMMPLIGSDLD